MSIVVVKGSSLEIKLRLDFIIKHPFKLSSNDKMLPSFKGGAIYLLKSAHKF